MWTSSSVMGCAILVSAAFATSNGAHAEGISGAVDLSWVRAMPPDEQPTRPSLAPVG